MRHPRARSAALAALLLLGLPGAASAQPSSGQPSAPASLTEAERTAALGRVRSLAACLSAQHHAMERVLRLVGESQQQRDTAQDARARQDAEAAIEALIARAATIQTRTRECGAGGALPSPGTTVVTRGPPADSAADSIAERHGTVRVTESDARLTARIHVVRGEQVDGQGQLDAAVVRAAVRGVASRLDRCYASYLRGGSLSPAQLDLVFTLRGTSARSVAVERSGFSDAAFERCVRTAGGRIRPSRGPSGGDAIYSYTLRFGG